MREPLLWWLVIEAVGIAAFPLTFFLFSSLRDRGYAFTKVLGLLLVAYGLWMGGILFSVPNTTLAVLALLLLMFTASLAVALSRRRELVSFARQEWRYLLFAEVLFAAAFAFFTLLRSYMPDIQYGEKPMNFAFLNAVLRSEEMPARDPWLSGHSLSYYYLGHLVIANTARLADVPSSVAFNLGSATIASLAALTIFGVTYNLVSGSAGLLRALLFGVVGAGLLTIVSNLEGLFELLAAHGVGSSGFYEWWEIHGLDGPRSTTAWYPTEMWWWTRTAFVADWTDGRAFPFTDFLFGDIHSPIAALPLALLTVGLALNALRSPEGLGWRSWLRSPGRLLLAALVLGSLGFTNLFDLPTYFGLLLIGAFVALRLGGGSSARGAAGRTLLYALPLGGLAVLLYLPFYLDFHPVGEGIHPLEAATREGWVTLRGTVTRPTHFLILWGPLIWLAASLAFVAVVALGRAAFSRINLFWASLSWLIPAAVWVGAIGVRRGPTGLGEEIATRGYAWMTALFLTVLLTTLALAFVGHLRAASAGQGRRSLLFALAATGLGVLLLWGIEFYWVQDPLGFRQNTTLRLGYQAWVLLAIGGAFGLHYLLSRWRTTSLSAALPRLGWAAGSAMVLGAALIFPLTVTFYVSGDFRADRVLDGLAYERRSNPDEYAAVSWLQDNVDGTPVVLEGIGVDYTWAARVSTRTGLPTVLGWSEHEYRWRGSWEPQAGRREDVEQAYNTTSVEEARAILEKYDVEYVYVGDLERDTYAEAGLAKFDEMGEVVFQQGDVTIYRIESSEDEAHVQQR